MRAARVSAMSMPAETPAAVMTLPRSTTRWETLAAETFRLADAETTSVRCRLGLASLLGDDWCGVAGHDPGAEPATR